MKSDFGESMFWPAAIEGGGDGSPHAVKAARRDATPNTDPMLEISHARQKPNSLLFFARIFRIVEPINNQGKA
ncbi:hypothetical protein ACU8NH_23380 [Rhizobium leguminosarum]|uniref:hypothetical protein n=1 Tax=Rhizobium TaxID=379 RepID=UPI000FEC7E0C|nr:hypothetical protein [Rhizobium leguminosarum]MBY5463284.1 hypothetical protein [Rhizobium leguminosarum]MBY5916192.1 hypothetical protein [Rhizobium leguminosarum]RWX41477.1 hypothetical protein EHH54_07445 [Rhizobium leguminosarum]TBE57113.1 hypothetical protein ELH04_23100 [Rhizobium leguminosarum]TBE94707.1 hypothetical protein ELG97_23685 [Rhizobium leguminosarum]